MMIKIHNGFQKPIALKQMSYCIYLIFIQIQIQKEGGENNFAIIFLLLHYIIIKLFSSKQVSIS